jgi:Uma2 family endonuclease
LLLKRDRLQAAGVPSYCLVDPDEPAVTVLELRQGRYEQVAHAVGDELCSVERPLPLTLVPARLLD